MIRLANTKDIPSIEEILYTVHDIHVNIRSDLFIKGKKKYTKTELENIINSNNSFIYVYLDKEILGYAICFLHEVKSESLVPIKTLYIDDLCVKENARGKHIGSMIYDFCINQAKIMGCYNVTLNVWEGNDAAKHFYIKKGMKVQKTVMEHII